LDKKIALSVAKTIGVYLQSRYRRLRSRGNVITEKQSVMVHEWVWVILPCHCEDRRCVAIRIFTAKKREGMETLPYA